MVGPDGNMVRLNFKLSLADDHVVPCTVDDRHLGQRGKDCGVMAMGSEQLWNNCEESEEVSRRCSNTNDASILGPVHFGDSSRAFLNIYSVLGLFNPAVTRVEFDRAL